MKLKLLGMILGLAAAPAVHAQASNLGEAPAYSPLERSLFDGNEELDLQDWDLQDEGFEETATDEQSNEGMDLSNTEGVTDEVMQRRGGRGGGGGRGAINRPGRGGGGGRGAINRPNRPGRGNVNRPNRPGRGNVNRPNRPNRPIVRPGRPGRGGVHRPGRPYYRGGWHRPGWRNGWRWNRAWRPRWYYAGVRFPSWIWVSAPIGYSTGYWQCTAFNENMQAFAAVGTSQNQAAFNAIYDCGGENNGCYIPSGYCRLR